MGTSNYSRKEKGILSMRNEEWEKIAEYLGIPVEEIYEQEEAQVIICKVQAVGIGVNNGTNCVIKIFTYNCPKASNSPTRNQYHP